MSFNAITWALSSPIQHSSTKFVLVALANCADEQGNCWPSIASLSDATAQDRKTVIANIKRLIESGWIEDTGQRKGTTGQIAVYRLNRTKNGTVKEAQKRNHPENGTVPVFPDNSTVFPVKESRFSVETVPKTGHGTYQEPIKEPVKETKTRKRAVVDWVTELASRGVDPVVADSWLQVRKDKRAAVTVVAVDGMEREAAKAGVSLDAALRMCCERGWAGFKASWLNEQPRGSPMQSRDAARAIASATRLEDFVNDQTTFTRLLG